MSQAVRCQFGLAGSGMVVDVDIWLLGGITDFSCVFGQRHR